MKTQRGHTKRNNLIDEGKSKGIDKVIDKMHKYKTMLPYCLNQRKIQKI